MPGPAMATTKPPHFTKHHRNPSKLSQNSRSGSSTKLHAPNLALTAIKTGVDHGTPKRVESSVTIRSEDHTAAAMREHGNNVSSFPWNWNGRFQF